MSQILDQFGRPIQRKTLAENQTARVGGLHTEFANHPSRGLTPAKLARIMQAAEQGDMLDQYDLFEDMEEKDGHIYSEMSKRKRALVGLDWSIKPPRNPTAKEEDDAAYADEVLRDMPDLSDLVLDLADAIGKGFALGEIEWEQVGRERLPHITSRPQRWFQVNPDNHNELRLRDGSHAGAALWPFGWIVHTAKAKSGYLTRTALFRVLAWPFLFKNWSVRDLAEFLEIYGLPLRLGTYQAGATDKEKATLLQAVLSIGHAAAGIVPEGMGIEFKEAAKGSSDPFKAMIEWCERTQSKAILGGTLTSQADGKSSTNALGNVHNDVRHDLLESDAMQLAGTLTRDLVYPLIALNRGGIDSMRRCPRFVFDTQEPEDLALYADNLPKLVDVGARIPTRFVHDKLRIPEAEGDEPVLQRASPLAALKTRTAALKTQADDRDVADDYVDQLDDAMAVLFDGLLEPVKRLVAAAKTKEEIRDGLFALYPQMDAKDMVDMMQRAFAAAELAGRYEVQKGQ